MLPGTCDCPGAMRDLVLSNGVFRLAGKEVVITEKLPSLTNVGDLLLADFSGSLLLETILPPVSVS
jgi:hypothetical protein